MTPLPKIDEILIRGDQNIGEALATIDKTAQGVCFVVDKGKKIIGVLTDGDIRRAFIEGADTSTSVGVAMNRDFVSFPIDTPDRVLQKALSDKIRHIPLLNSEGVPVDYACLNRLHRLPVMEPQMGDKELSYVTDCIKTNWVSSQGKYVLKFEEMLSDYCGMPYALAVSNGTAALQIALEALEIGKGDEVIVPDLTFAATINAVIHVNAIPVIVDVDPFTWNIDPGEIKKAISKKTKAVIPVHLYGFPADMPAIRTIAEYHGIKIIEDAAEALGSEIEGKKVGSFGDAAIFSFFGNKVITTGEGGMVLFNDKTSFERALKFRDHGMSKSKRYWHEVVGYNFRMTNLQAAVGVAQMEKIESIIHSKKDVSDAYQKILRDSNYCNLPPQHPDIFNIHWLYTILLKDHKIDRDSLIEKMMLNGIDCRPIFYPLHLMEIYKPYANGAFPDATNIGGRGLSLPSSPNLTIDQIENVCSTLDSLLRTHELLEQSGRF